MHTAVRTRHPLQLDLPYTAPLAWEPLVDFLAGRGALQLERLDGRRYLRTARINDCSGWLVVEPSPIPCALRVTASATLEPVAAELTTGLRSLFDLDADPAAVTAGLQRDPLLADLVATTPGLRLPGTLSLFELGLRAILGQQVTVKAATTLFNRLVERFGDQITTPFDGLDRLCPRPEALADTSLQSVIDLGLTQRRAATLQGFARAVADGSLDIGPGHEPEAAMARLTRLPGIGPWTAHYIAMRALSHADAFPEADIGLMRACGIDRPAMLRARAEAWRPWRAYAAMHLWNWRNTGG
ncbi:MAG: DNA-3-methyladenine glycosylase 2 family protein [Ectothiorhodospiraceae bacterium]|nr:DNA-3-methyladenine glycosylase 2 family protein [Ectothiorhodospiraceae bacterium]